MGARDSNVANNVGYARELVGKIERFLGIQIEFKEISGLKYYSKILKSGVRTNKDFFISSIIIGLNLEKLQTKRKIREALAHELSHLFPDVLPFKNRLPIWRSIVKSVDQEEVLKMNIG